MTAPSSAATSAATAPARERGPRIPAVDWLRGFAVILMMLAHTADAWLLEQARVGSAWDAIRFLSGLPSRLFLFLVGVSAAIKFEGELARGEPPSAMRRGLTKRGVQMLVLAYVFRLQEHLLAGFHGGWEMLFRVDILNCIGASMLVLAAFCVPRAGRPAIARAVVVLIVLVGLGPWIGPAQFPTWLPRPLTSYLGGQRPMAWFSLFPFGCWAVVGLLAGHWWVRASRHGRQAQALLGTGALGAALVVGALIVDRVAPRIVPYRSTLAEQMGYSAFFLRVGAVGLCAGISYLAVRWMRPDRFSPVRQLGQTSLLIYWVHVDLCYGGIARPLRRALTLPQMVIGLVVLTLLMLGLSLFRTRVWPGWAPRFAARLRLTRTPAEANLRRP